MVRTPEGVRRFHANERCVTIPSAVPHGDDITLGRLEDQIAWYDMKSGANQRWYKRLKVAQLVSAAAIPVVATLGAHAAILGTLGAAVVVIEGISQLNQFAVNWQTYRATAESLKHEKYLYLAHAGPYAGSADGTALLADRIEGLISQEHAKWVSAREEADRALPGAEKK
jgi:hypothetical protein